MVAGNGGESGGSSAGNGGDNMAELEALMKQFPDWKEKFPDIYNQLHPTRHHKSLKTGRDGAATNAKFHSRSRSVPKTDYQATYTRKLAKVRPRSTKKPPPSPRDPNPPPMVLKTSQRQDFVPKDLSARALPIKQESSYEPSSAPLDGTSYYMQEFSKSYDVLPPVRARAPDPPRGRPDARFSSATTNKEHYKSWVPQPAFTFGELPCFTGSILYPEKSKVPESTTRGTYKGVVGHRPDPAIAAQGNITLEGEHHMETTTGQTYRAYEGAQPATRVVFKPEIPVRRRGKLQAETQSMHDFHGYATQPAPPKPVEPPQATIQIRFNDRHEFETEQRVQYRGVDPRQHPMPKSCKKDTDTYQPPAVKMDTTTCQQRDYPPLDVSSAYQPPAKAPQSRRPDKPATFHADTTNKTFFKAYDVQPRVRYGDFHEGHKYVPPADKFLVSSTTQDTYVRKSAEVPASFKPLNKPIDSIGSHDFTTRYRAEFVAPRQLDMLRPAEKATLLRELRARKAAQEARGRAGLAQVAAS